MKNSSQYTIGQSQATREEDPDKDEEYRDKMIDFTDEASFQKRQDYTNFLRRDNVDAIMEQLLKDQVLTARLTLRGPIKNSIWKPDKYRIPKKGGLAMINLNRKE